MPTTMFFTNNLKYFKIFRDTHSEFQKIYVFVLYAEQNVLWLFRLIKQKKLVACWMILHFAWTFVHLHVQLCVVKILQPRSNDIAFIFRMATLFTHFDHVSVYESKLIYYLYYWSTTIYNTCEKIMPPINKFQNESLKKLRCKQYTTILIMLHRITV